ncbi:MAG: GAF domain-containing protein, partial [Anaerolineae bacterium]
MIGVSTDITERVRVEEEIKRRNRELAALNAIATTMMQSALDLDEVLQRTADGIVEGLGCNTAFIFLLDEKEAIFRGGAVSTKAKILERLNAIIGSPLLQIKIPARSDFNEAVSNLLDGRITIRHDFYELVSPLLSRPVCSAMQRLLGSKTFFTMPLLAKGKVVGGIVASTREEISERDTEKLMTFANQAAIAIENARLYEASRRRSEELAALHATSLNITVPHDLPTLLQTIVERAARLLDAPGGGMYLCDPERREVRCVVSYNTPRDYTGTVLKYGEGAAGRVAETGEPLIIDDYRTWSSRAAVYEEEQPFSTVLSAPMIWQDQVTGVIHVLHDVETRRFTQADLELLSLFASQAAIAIENARLYEETRQRALEQETVSYIAYALNTPDVREAFPALAEGLQDLTGCEVVSLIAMDEAGEQFITTVLESPFPILEEGNVMPLSATAAAEDLEAGRPHLTADLSTETHFPLEQSLFQAGLRWWVTLSLLVGGEVFGGLSLGGSDTGLFREDQLPVLRQIADAVALALQNSFIFLAEREQRELAESLEDATAALTATLDFDQVLDRILEQVSRVVPNDATNIMLIEGDQAHIVRWRGYERFGDEEFASTAVFHLPERATLQQMVETRKPTVVPDTTTGPDWVHVPVQEWLRSYAAAPIIVRGEVIGFLNVDSATPGFFTPDHAKILRAFATHAATAIENARLYEAERKRRAELEALRQASLHLASTLELQPILEAILEHALKLVAADDAHVFLYDGERLAFG